MRPPWYTIPEIMIGEFIPKGVTGNINVISSFESRPIYCNIEINMLYVFKFYV